MRGFSPLKDYASSHLRGFVDVGSLLESGIEPGRLLLENSSWFKMPMSSWCGCNMQWTLERFVSDHLNIAEIFLPE